MSRCWKFTHSSRQERPEGRRGVEERGTECWEQPGRTINHAGEAMPEGQSSKAGTVDRIVDEGGAEGGEWFGTRGARRKGVFQKCINDGEILLSGLSCSRKCLCLKGKIFTQRSSQGSWLRVLGEWEMPQGSNCVFVCTALPLFSTADKICRV